MSTEDVALAIIAAIDGDDFGNVRVETEPMENVLNDGEVFFDVTSGRRHFVVTIREDEA